MDPTNFAALSATSAPGQSRRFCDVRVTSALQRFWGLKSDIAPSLRRAKGGRPSWVAAPSGRAAASCQRQSQIISMRPWPDGYRLAHASPRGSDGAELMNSATLVGAVHSPTQLPAARCAGRQHPKRPKPHPRHTLLRQADLPQTGPEQIAAMAKLSPEQCQQHRPCSRSQDQTFGHVSGTINLDFRFRFQICFLGKRSDLIPWRRHAIGNAPLRQVRPRRIGQKYERRQWPISNHRSLCLVAVFSANCQSCSSACCSEPT